jgi:subtilisin family serine protease
VGIVDDKPVIFVPSASKLVDFSLDDPENIEGHRDLMRLRRGNLADLARNIDDRLVADSNLRILEGVEALVMSEASAQIGVEKGLGTILSDRFYSVEAKPRAVSLKQLPEQHQWHLRNIGLTPEDTLAGGRGIVVGIADSWIYDHPGIDKSHQLAVSAFDSKGTPVTGHPVASKHGTAITSLILGDVGVARACDFAFASVLTNCSGNGCSGGPVQVAAGLDWLVKTLFQTNRRVRVINASLDVSQTAEMTALVMSAWRDQVLIVGASGNFGGSSVACPAIIKNVVGVGALKKDDTAWSLTTKSKTKPELWAPGDGVMAANTLQEYSPVSGTSAAAALATGGAAAILSSNPRLKVEQLRPALLAKTIPVDEPNGVKQKLWFGKPAVA